MKAYLTFKYVLLTFFLITIANFAEAQLTDTALYLYKSTGDRPIIVSNPDSADYIRVISPFTATQPLIDINEYYKDGTLKFTGKAERRFFNQVTGYATLNGICMGFFPSKKRERITNYSLFGKDGAEYLYYPDGKLYKSIENKIDPTTHISEGRLLDCFDKDGVQICKDGNGLGIDYNWDFRGIVEEGSIKNGKKEGEWKGRISTDASKFIILYKNGVFKSGTGYDRNGKAYPFTKKYEEADYKNGPISFVGKLKALLVSAKGSKEIKRMIDSTTISFTVDEEGHLKELKTLNQVSPELLQDLKEALEKSPSWEPTKFYGIPLKTNVELGLRISSGANGSNAKTVRYSLTTYYAGELLEKVPARMLNIFF